MSTRGTYTVLRDDYNYRMESDLQTSPHDEAPSHGHPPPHSLHPPSLPHGLPYTPAPYPAAYSSHGATNPSNRVELQPMATMQSTQQEEEEDLVPTSASTPLIQPQLATPPNTFGQGAQMLPGVQLQDSQTGPPQSPQPARGTQNIPPGPPPGGFQASASNYSAYPPTYPPTYPAAHHPQGSTNISSNTSNVVELQPMASTQPASTGPPPKVNDHFFLTIVLAFVATFICFNPFIAVILIPALICAGLAADYNKEGKLDKARSYGEAAFICDVVVIVIAITFFACVAVAIGVFVIMLIFGFNN